MKEDWTKQLRQKLAGHRKTPPAGLWEGISEQMDKPFGFKPLSRMTGTAQRWWAAAAAVLALVGYFAYHQHSNNDAPLQAEVIPQAPQQIIPSEPSEQTKPSEPSSVSTPSATQEPQVKNQIEKTLVLVVPRNEVVNLPDSVVEGVEAQPTPDEPEKTTSPKTINSNPAILYEPMPKHDSPSRSGKWSLGINASGGLLAANASQRTDRLYYMEISNLNKVGMSSYSSYTLTEYESKHHLPLRFGLSLQYQLNDRLALLGGINYTYLYSEFSIPLYPSVNYDQKLHYLGLPLGVSWQLLAASRFHLYLAGGVMLEKCLNEKPWQWSVSGTVGAEYAITSLFGIYLEPSLGYYFKDGTQFEHYYKEHPLAPSIEFGLRLHLNE